MGSLFGPGPRLYASMASGDSGETAARVGQLVAIVPLVLFAAVSIAMILMWAPDPRWGFVIVLPFTFMIALTWLAFGEGP